MRLLLIISSLLLFQTADAQFGKKLKDRAKEAAERRANRKVDETIDKGFDKIDSVVTGKKRPKNTNTGDNGQSGSNNNASATEPTGSTANENGEFIIKTNITCETGKELIEKLLRDDDEVTSVSIDTDTGKVYLTVMSGDAAVYTKSIELICKNGFTADGKKPTTKTNPCK